MVAVLVILSLSFFVLNFAYVFHAEVQAQNDADAAAQVAVIPQVSQFNELSLALYSSTIEEYRIRHVLNSLLMNVRGVGGCDANPQSPIRSGVYQTDLNCDDNYPELRSELFEAVNRYTADISLVEAITDVKASDQQTSAQNALTDLQQACGNGVNCNEKYILVKTQPRQNLSNVESSSAYYSFTGYDAGTTAKVAPAFTPEIADVAVCEVLKPLLPNLFGKSLPSLHIVARAAATPIAASQEWFTPGRVIDMTSAAAAPGSTYNVNEYYVPYLTVDGTGWDWNDVPFWGFDSTTNGANGGALGSTTIPPIANWANLPPILRGGMRVSWTSPHLNRTRSLA